MDRNANFDKSDFYKLVLIYPSSVIFGILTRYLYSRERLHGERDFDEAAGKVIDSKSHRIFDVRPVDAYNGWTLKGERRGGHIRGAKAIPVSWTDEENWDDIVRSKGLMPNHQIVVYGYTSDDAVEVAERFVISGYKEVSVYSRFVDEWAANESLPMDQMERFENWSIQDGSISSFPERTPRVSSEKSTRFVTVIIGTRRTMTSVISQEP